MIFFFDANISQYAAHMLGHFDRKNEMRASIDYFKEGTADTEWIPVVASWSNNPVAVCGDGRILRNRVQKQLLKDHELRFVFLASGWTKQTWEVIAWKIVKVWPNIVRSIKQARHPMVWEVTINLKIQPIGRISGL